MQKSPESSGNKWRIASEIAAYVGTTVVLTMTFINGTRENIDTAMKAKYEPETQPSRAEILTKQLTVKRGDEMPKVDGSGGVKEIQQATK